MECSASLKHLRYLVLYLHRIQPMSAQVCPRNQYEEAAYRVACSHVGMSDGYYAI